MGELTQFGQIGVVGVFALLLVREVFHFLKERNNRSRQNGPSGEKSVEFWQKTMRAEIIEALEPTNEHLKAIRANQHTTNNAIANMSSEILLELARLARKP